MFADRVRGHFAISQRQKTMFSELMVDGEVVSDPQALLKYGHFTLESLQGQ